MKNRRVYFDDAFFWTALSLCIVILSLMLLVLCILQTGEIPIAVYAVLIITLFVFSIGSYLFPKMGISFDYDKGVIKYFGFYKIKRPIVRMSEVRSIAFEEIRAPRKKHVIFTPKTYVIFGEENGIKYVYRAGKLFKFTLVLTDGSTIKIPYFNMFKAISKKRVSKQENRIKKIIDEFNDFAIGWNKNASLRAKDDFAC